METPCSLWTGTISPSGYGIKRVRLPEPLIRYGKTIHVVSVLAHRAAYEDAHGPIESGMVVRHKCDVRACVNADHLEIGTRADNVRDMWERGRAHAQKERPPKGPGNDRLRAAVAAMYG